MTDLIKRLEETWAGSDNLDREVERALGLVPMGIREDGTWGLKQRPWTTSLDAASALVERVLSGWDVTISTHFDFCAHKRGPHARVSRPTGALGEYDDKTAGYARAATPALALCAAILKATDTRRE